MQRGTLFKKYNDSDVLLARLLREKETYASNYNKYARKLEDARIDQTLKLERISNISISQAPTYPFAPDASKKKFIIKSICSV